MYNVFTTFGPQHQKLYGKNFVETFIRNWPEEVHLYVYYEKDFMKKYNNKINQESE